MIEATTLTSRDVVLNQRSFARAVLAAFHSVNIGSNETRLDALGEYGTDTIETGASALPPLCAPGCLSLAWFGTGLETWPAVLHHTQPWDFWHGVGMSFFGALTCQRPGDLGVLSGTRAAQIL